MKPNSSYLQKPADVDRKWYVIDAAGKPLGRVAATAASILRGKHLPTFTPNVDCGDFVIIINAAQAVLTGNKLNQKVRYYHTGWVGGIKEIHYDKLMAEKPEQAMIYAVNGMLPNNSIGRKAGTRLKVYANAEHNHEAQKPVAWTQEIK
ncbi:MAG: 50S ribosomal protein L13 [Clostridiales bacterium]|nr:50S ribosomal protein L13 [Clostridiales bacterium]